jgi:hypothetical protein
MKLSKRMFTLVVAASLGLGMSAMAQGRSGGHANVGGPGIGGPDMGNPNVGGPGMGAEHGPGSMGPTGQSNSMGTTSGPRTASDMLTQNTTLASHLASTFGVSSSTLLSDANGFKNLGLFIAAIHVSKNLSIPFNTLSNTMSSNGDNLGKAIHSLDPTLSKSDVKNAINTANSQAKKDIKNSHQ